MRQLLVGSFSLQPARLAVFLKDRSHPAGHEAPGEVVQPVLRRTADHISPF